MILLVGNFPLHSRGTRFPCEDLAERLPGAGFEVLTTSHQGSRPMRVADMLWTTWHQRKRYRVAQIDVYSGNAFLWSQAVCWILRRIHKPYFLVLHGGNLPVFALKREKQVRELLQSAKIVITPSRYLLEQMKPYRADLMLIPNAVDLSHYPFRLRENPAPRLVWLRAFHHMYNPMLAPRIIANLVADYPQLELFMIGPDKGDGSLQETQQVARELGVFNRIQFPGSVSKSDVPMWLNKGDIFINTTHIDNTPVSVIEAMACGLCIVSTNVGGIPYLLDHEQDALTVPPDDLEAMTSALRRILAEPGLAARLSRNAGQKAHSFDWSVVLPQWQQLFSGLQD